MASSREMEALTTALMNVTTGFKMPLLGSAQATHEDIRRQFPSWMADLRTRLAGIDDIDRVWTLTLSALSRTALAVFGTGLTGHALLRDRPEMVNSKDALFKELNSVFGNYQSADQAFQRLTDVVRLTEGMTANAYLMKYAVESAEILSVTKDSVSEAQLALVLRLGLASGGCAAGISLRNQMATREIPEEPRAVVKAIKELSYILDTGTCGGGGSSGNPGGASGVDSPRGARHGRADGRVSSACLGWGQQCRWKCLRRGPETLLQLQ